MESSQNSQVNALNEYITALQRQIKSFQNQRQSLVQQITKTEVINNKSDNEARQLRSDLKQLNSILYRQTVEKTNIQKRVIFLQQENNKLKKQVESMQQMIIQQNHNLKQQSDLFAQEKSNIHLTTTQNTKQITTLENKIRQLQTSLSQTIEQKLLANVEVDSINLQLSISKKQNQMIKQENLLKQKQIQSISFQLKAFAEENQKLVTQIQHGNQGNQQVRKSYEYKIEQMKQNQQKVIKSLNEQIENQKLEIERLTEEIKTHKQFIENLNSSLAQQKQNVKQLFYTKQKQSQQINSLNQELLKLQQQINDEILNKGSVLSSKQKEFYDLKERYQSIQLKLQQNIAQAQVNMRNLTLKNQILEQQNQHQIKIMKNQVDSLREDLSLKFLQVTQIKHNLLQTQNSLKEKTIQFEEKQKQCQLTLQKQKQIQQQINYYMSEISSLQGDRTAETKKLKNQIEILDEEIIDFKKKDVKLTKLLRQTEEKHSQKLLQFDQYKESSYQKQTQAMKKVKQIQKQLQIRKNEYKQKEQKFRGLGNETQFKSKQFANKEQQLQKRYSQVQNKYGKLKLKMSVVQKQLEQKDQEYKKKIEVIHLQQKNQIKQVKIKLQEQFKLLLTKKEEEISLLSLELEQKQDKLKQLQQQINEMKKVSFNKLQFNQSEMQKQIMILRHQLQQSQVRATNLQQNLIKSQSELQKIRHQLIQKELKLEILNAQLQKTKKDNQWLSNSAIVLQEQVDALQNSTTYLKRQIASALDNQQISMKQIRFLKDANRQMSKMYSSKTIVVDRSGHDKRTKTTKMEINKSNFSIDSENKSIDNPDMTSKDTLQESEALQQNFNQQSPKQCVTRMMKLVEQKDG